MDATLKRHLLEESKHMLDESKKALTRAQDELHRCIAEVEQGDYHPLRKTFQKKNLSEITVKEAVQSYEQRKRTLATAQQQETAKNESKSKLDRELAERISVEEARVKQELERAASLRLEAEQAEEQRLEAERSLAEEKARLERIEKEKSELKRRIEEEQLAVAKLAKEKQDAERLEKLAKEEAARQELEERARKLKEAEQERIAEQERLTQLEKQHAAQKLAAKQKAEEDERKAREVASQKLAAEEKAQQLELERKAREEAEQNQRAQEEEAERVRKQEQEAAILAAAAAASAAALAHHEEEKHVDDDEEEALRSALAEREAQEDDDEEEALRSALAEREAQEDDEEQALRSALAERQAQERSLHSPPDDAHDVDVPQTIDEGEEEEEEEIGEEEHVPDQTIAPESAQSNNSFAEKKYVTIQDVMLQPARTRFLTKTLKQRVLVLREDKFRYYDENQSKMLGGMSLAEEGVEVALTPLKKSPSGLSLRFTSPTLGSLEFYPANEQMGRKWISAIEHNMEMRYELPDLGPEEAPTYYDYLGVQPEHADSSTLLQAFADKTRGATDEWLRGKLNEALQVLNDPFKRVEYDNFVMVQRKYRFGGVCTVQIKTARGEATDAVVSRVFTDASFAYLFWQDIRLGPSLTGRHLCVELARVQEVQPGSTNMTVNLLLNNAEVLMFIFKEKREAEDFGAAVRFAKMPTLSAARRRQSVIERSV